MHSNSNLSPRMAERWKLSINVILVYISIFSFYNTGAIGVLTLSPSVIAPVCQVGDRLELTCSTTVATYLRWTLSVLNEQLQTRDIERNINSDDTSAQMSNERVNSTLFNFRRNSNQGASPLVSTLTIINVTNNLNGTEVHCEEVDGSMSANFTTIIIVEADQKTANCSVRIISEQYGTDSVQVSVKLAQHKYMTCNASILPQVPIYFNGSTTFQVTFLYNVKYNLSVEGKALCRNSMITSMRLHYVNCGYPLPSTDPVLKVTGYKGPPMLEGSIVNFYCSSGLVLIGNNSATCTTHGQWTPDPKYLMCNESYCGNPLRSSTNDFSHRLTAYSDLPTSVYFSCPFDLVLTGPNTTTCVNNSQWEPDPSKIMCSRVEDNNYKDVRINIIIAFTVIGASSVAALITFVLVFKFRFTFMQNQCKRVSGEISDQTRSNQSAEVDENKTGDAPQQEIQLEEILVTNCPILLNLYDIKASTALNKVVPLLFTTVNVSDRLCMLHQHNNSDCHYITAFI